MFRGPYAACVFCVYGGSALYKISNTLNKTGISAKHVLQGTADEGRRLLQHKNCPVDDALERFSKPQGIFHGQRNES